MLSSTIHGVERPKRQPYDPDMTSADDMVDLLLMYPFFREINPKKLPKLKSIVQFDSRVRRYEKGDIILRRGDYGNSAFFIITGHIHVVTEWKEQNKLADTLLGRSNRKQKNFFQALAQLWTNPRIPEMRSYFKPQANQTSSGINGDQSEVLTRLHKGETRGYFRDIESFIAKHETIRLNPGEMFGEIASMTRSPRNATIIAGEEIELLEIRWQGLRDLRRLDPSFKEFIDSRYLERSVKNVLSNNELFNQCSKEDIKEISKQTLFESYGYEQDSSSTGGEQQEEVILKQGFYPNGLIIVINGFVRITQPYGSTQRTTNYLRRGQCFGLQEITHNWKNKDDHIPYKSTLHAMGMVDILTIPVHLVEKFILSNANPETIQEWLGEDNNISAVAGHDTVEFLMENRFINGTAAMVINMDRCTRCDDCVRACSDTHQSNPRFIRHGKQSGPFMVANACMHCVDPVCMIDCPTGAIHRNEDSGEVIINDQTCIGCSNCANHCPYDNIRMVELRNTNGALIVDETTNQPVLKATKCDLCYDGIGGPACVRACPHDALKRVDLQNISQLTSWMKS